MAFLTAIAVGLALLIMALVAATGTSKDTAKAQSRAAGGPVSLFVGSLAYVVVLTPVIASDGVTAVSMILLVVVAALPPVIGGLGVRVRDRLPVDSRRTFDAAGVIVSFILLFGLLATASSVLSLIGGVNRIVTAAGIALAIAGYIVVRGRVGANRTSRWAIGFAAVVPVLFFVLGFGLGQAPVITSSLVPSTPVPIGTAVAMILAVVGMSFVDPVMGQTLRASAKPGRAATWGAIISVLFVLVFSLGLIMVFGGAFVAPTLQAFLIAAFGGVGIAVFMFFAATVLVPTADTQLAAAADSVEHMAPQLSKALVTFGLAIVAALLAMFVPATGQIVSVAAVLAAAVFGALLPALAGEKTNYPTLPGVIVGVLAAIVVAVIMSVNSVMTFQAATTTALIAAFVLSAATSLLMSRRSVEPAAA